MIDEDHLRTLPHDPTTTGVVLPRPMTEMEKQTAELRKLEQHARYTAVAAIVTACVVVAVTFAGIVFGILMSAAAALG